MSEGRVTLMGEVIAEIAKGNPAGRLKSIDYGQYGAIVRVEWYDDPPAGLPAGLPAGDADD